MPDRIDTGLLESYIAQTDWKQTPDQSLLVSTSVIAAQGEAATGGILVRSYAAAHAIVLAAEEATTVVGFENLKEAKIRQAIETLIQFVKPFIIRKLLTQKKITALKGGDVWLVSPEEAKKANAPYKAASVGKYQGDWLIPVKNIEYIKLV